MKNASIVLALWLLVGLLCPCYGATVDLPDPPVQDCHGAPSSPDSDSPANCAETCELASEPANGTEASVGRERIACSDAFRPDSVRFSDRPTGLNDRWGAAPLGNQPQAYILHLALLI